MTVAATFLPPDFRAGRILAKAFGAWRANLGLLLLVSAAVRVPTLLPVYAYGSGLTRMIAASAAPHGFSFQHLMRASAAGRSEPWWLALITILLYLTVAGFVQYLALQCVRGRGVAIGDTIARFGRRLWRLALVAGLAYFIMVVAWSSSSCRASSSRPCSSSPISPPWPRTAASSRA